MLSSKLGLLKSKKDNAKSDEQCTHQGHRFVVFSHINDKNLKINILQNKGTDCIDEMFLIIALCLT